MCMHLCLCSVGLRGCTEEKTVVQKEKCPGQPVMVDQQVSPGDAVGLGRGQGQVQPGSSLPEPAAVSGVGWWG